MFCVQADKKSLICLLLPFFGLWALFWLVPIILGFDLSLQNPNRLVAHWEDIELANDKTTILTLNYESYDFYFEDILNVLNTN